MITGNIICGLPLSLSEYFNIISVIQYRIKIKPPHIESLFFQVSQPKLFDEISDSSTIIHGIPSNWRTRVTHPSTWLMFLYDIITGCENSKKKCHILCRLSIFFLSQILHFYRFSRLNRVLYFPLSVVPDKNDTMALFSNHFIKLCSTSFLNETFSLIKRR